MQNILSRIRDAALQRLTHMEILDLSTAFEFREGWQNILPGLGDDRLFMGEYEEGMILERLEHYGIMEGLRARGIRRVKVLMNTADRDYQHLQLKCSDPPCDDPLGEITLHKGMFATKAPFASSLHGLVIPMLFVQWIRLQNPLSAEFTPDHPRMPGQRHPGLGVGSRVMEMLAALGSKLGTDGLANTPEYPHNAVLYAQRFKYLDPRMQGVLKALRRDLAKVSLADASWGIMLGCVRERNSGETLRWPREEQILPLGGALLDHFASGGYKEAVSRAAGAVSYELDAGKLALLRRELPGNLVEPDGISLVEGPEAGLNDNKEDSNG